MGLRMVVHGIKPDSVLPGACLKSAQAFTCSLTCHACMMTISATQPLCRWMQLVPAVSELIVAELLYLQYQDRTKPLYMYINSTGTSRADGETVSHSAVKCNWHLLACLQSCDAS